MKPGMGKPYLAIADKTEITGCGKRWKREGERERDKKKKT